MWVMCRYEPFYSRDLSIHSLVATGVLDPSPVDARTGQLPCLTQLQKLRSPQYACLLQAGDVGMLVVQLHLGPRPGNPCSGIQCCKSQVRTGDGDMRGPTQALSLRGSHLLPSSAFVPQFSP